MRQRLTLREYQRLCSDDASPARRRRAAAIIPRARFERLRRHDEAWARARGGQPMLRWDDDEARADRWVGVIQVPGLCVEILPKLDDLDDAHPTRDRLLDLLSLAGMLPHAPRGVASLRAAPGQLAEALLLQLGTSLRDALHHELPRDYAPHEDALPALRGRVDVAQQLRQPARADRIACRFDAMTDDHPLNRALKATVTHLLTRAQHPSTIAALRQCHDLLRDARDIAPHPDLFEPFLPRHDQLSASVALCQLALQGMAPGMRAGDVEAMSLCFDMSAIFEGAITALMQERVLPQLPGVTMRAQALGDRRPLLRDARTGQTRLHMRPDLLLRDATGRALILDAKWKRLDWRRDGGDGVSREDLYQLHAYQQAYDAPCVALIYPHVRGAQARDYQQAHDPARRTLVRTLDLGDSARDRAWRDALAQQLLLITRQGLDL